MNKYIFSSHYIIINTIQHYSIQSSLTGFLLSSSSKGTAKELVSSTLWNLMRSMAYFPRCWMMYLDVTCDSYICIGCLHYCIHPPQLLALRDSCIDPVTFSNLPMKKKSHKKEFKGPMTDDFYILRTKGNTIKLKGDYKSRLISKCWSCI